jgi:hypothetical protein
MEPTTCMACNSHEINLTKMDARAGVLKINGWGAAELSCAVYLNAARLPSTLMMLRSKR